VGKRSALARLCRKKTKKRENANIFRPTGEGKKKKMPMNPLSKGRGEGNFSGGGEASSSILRWPGEKGKKKRNVGSRKKKKKKKGRSVFFSKKEDQRRRMEGKREKRKKVASANIFNGASQKKKEKEAQPEHAGTRGGEPRMCKRQKKEKEFPRSIN